MSKQTREMFEQVKDGGPPKGIVGAIAEGVQAVAPGLSLSAILGDIGAELGRLGVQGQMEMASALFTGNAFVPYGPGQYTPTDHEHDYGRSADHGPPQQEVDGREM